MSRIRTTTFIYIYIFVNLIISIRVFAGQFDLVGAFRLSNGGIFHNIGPDKYCGYRSFPEYLALTGALSYLDAPLIAELPPNRSYTGICRPPASIKYFGYYASAMTGVGSPSGNYIASTANHANLVWIAGVSTADTIQKLSEAQAYGKKAVVVVNRQFFDNGRTFILFAEQSRRWTEFSSAVRPYASSIAAFYPLDEPYLLVNQMQVDPDYMYQYLSSIADFIHGTYPGKPVAVIQSYAEIVAGYVPPANFDWYGIDCYGSWNSCGDSVYGYHSIPWYYSVLKGWLPTDKKFILVPDSNLPREAYAGTWVEADITFRASQYARYAVVTPGIVAVIPFTYQSFCDYPNPDDPYDFFDPLAKGCFRGASDMPSVLDYYKWLGLGFSRM
jgi:hypothetical protein